MADILKAIKMIFVVEDMNNLGAILLGVLKGVITNIRDDYR